MMILLTFILFLLFHYIPKSPSWCVTFIPRDEDEEEEEEEEIEE